MPDTPPLVRVCALLNAADARYLVAGGHACILHGIVRTTEDVHVLIEPTEENAARVIRALAQLEDGAAAELTPRDLLDNVVVKTADEVEVDVSTHAWKVTCADAIGSAREIVVEWLARMSCVLLLSCCLPLGARDYRFNGNMSEAVLRNYLSRSMTTMYLLTSHGNFNDHVRLLTNCGAKFAGRAVYQWGREESGAPALPKKLDLAKGNAATIHRADPELILQACIFEIVSRDVNNLEVPAWAFAGLGRPVEQRNFRYEDMIYASGRSSNQWGQGSSVPDVSRAETKLWFYFLARSYIDAGCEAIHYGQVELMNGNDPKLDHWAEVLAQARRYAATNARRHFLLCDAHVPRGGFARDGQLLFDFHSFPLRIEEVADKPKQAQLRVGYTDAIYGRSRGGLTPSGWRCEHLPYLVEFDNYGRSRKPGEAGQGRFWVWGWDEITWFSQQSEDDRNDWLRYAWSWVREHDAEGYVQMPGMRIISGAADGRRWYDVHQPSAATPTGFGQENTIRALWLADTNGAPGDRPRASP